MSSWRVRVSYLFALLFSVTAAAQLAAPHSLATRLVQLEGDVKILGNGSLIFSDNTVQSTAGVVSVAPGAGIAVTGSQSVTVSVADGGIGATKIDPAEVQRRVTGNCTGSIVAVNQDGTVTCGVIGQTAMITTDGNLVVPAGVGHLFIEAWGGGGSGAGFVGGQFATGGGGGGAGGYARAYLPVTEGLSLIITVGQGGAGTFSTSGNYGGDTSIAVFNGILIPLLLVNGGSGGSITQGGPGGIVSTFVPLIALQRVNGGDGGAGNIFNNPGGGGVPAFSGVPGTGGAGSPNASTQSQAGTPGLLIVTYQP